MCVQQRKRVNYMSPSRRLIRGINTFLPLTFFLGCVGLGTSVGAYLASRGPVIKEEYTETLHEEAVVITKLYAGQIEGDQAKNEVPENLGVVLRSKKHGTFTFQCKDQETYRNLYDGESVEIGYKEKHRKKLDDLDNDGEKDDLVEDTFIGLEFVEIAPKK